MLVVLTETYCNKVNIQITQRDDFIQINFEASSLPSYHYYKCGNQYFLGCEYLQLFQKSLVLLQQCSVGSLCFAQCLHFFGAWR